MKGCAFVRLATDWLRVLDGSQFQRSIQNRNLCQSAGHALGRAYPPLGKR